MQENNFQSGALIDTRTEEQKQTDIHFGEIVAAAAPVVWVEKDPKDWRRFPDQDQNGSSSCVMQTTRKIAGVSIWLKEKTYVPFSGAYYNLRSNKPSPGMIGVEAFEIWKNYGLPLEQLVPSEKMTDAQMDAIQVEQYEKDIAKIFRINAHIGIDNGDFETVASVIQQTGKAVMDWFYFTSAEWSREIPIIIDPNLNFNNSLHHSVAAVDFFLYHGKKYIRVEDSAHFAGLTSHLISEEFFKVRNWFNRYPMNFAFDDQTSPAIPGNLLHSFERALVFIPWDSAKNQPADLQLQEIQKADMIALQNILKYEGCFPANISSTGYYGATTASGVYKLQVKHNIDTKEALDALAGRRVGSKTLQYLNSVYFS